jgi:RNA polymerase sigma-B factor
MAASMLTGHGVLEDRETDVVVLVRRWQEHGDQRARETLLERFTPLARNLAKRYARSSTPMDDLFQVALYGLLKAIDRFDPDRGGRLQSFAIPTILGELRRYFRDSGWGVHVPRGAQERALEVRDAREHLANELGQAPTAYQLAQFLEIDLEQVLDGLQALNAYDASSLEAPRRDEEGGTVADTVGAEDPNFDLAENHAMLGVALRALPERERAIVAMRFAEELTQDEIATRVGVSQMQVSRLLRRALRDMRATIEGDRLASGG